ncbi:hypothetical protein HOY80DRAFT_169920 [Tuber brumale]|nr:hypothetical protein HOY80DRAFT_169920 [Tuber brumale]
MGLIRKANDPPPPAFSEIQPDPKSPPPPNTAPPEKPPIAHEPPKPQPQPQQQQPQFPVSGGAPALYINTVPLQSLTRSPAPVQCPVCGARGLTVVSYETGNTTHMAALLLCFIASLGCIPYMFNACKDVAHSCASCGTMLTLWHRSGTPGASEVLVHPVTSGPQVPVKGGVK